MTTVMGCDRTSRIDSAYECRKRGTNEPDRGYGERIADALTPARDLCAARLVELAEGVSKPRIDQLSARPATLHQCRDHTKCRWPFEASHLETQGDDI